MTRSILKSLPRRACYSVCCWHLSVTPSFANDDPDWLPQTEPETTKESATAPTSSTASQPGRLFIELAGDYTEQSNSANALKHGNIGLDGYFTRQFGDDWRGLLSGRFDFDSQAGMGLSTRNLSVTLREAYLTRYAGDWTTDIGRINVRDGVAVSFSPSDVFRDGSIPVPRTQDPARLRESRLGVVGLRVQDHTSYGELTGLVSPHLEVPTDPSWYDPLWGAVNDGNAQLYLKYTPPRWRGIYGNVMLHQEEGGNRTFAVNATDNFGQAVVGYVEYAYKREPTLTSLAFNPAAPASDYSQLSAGISITTESRQTFTFEYEHNGGGVSRSDWTGPWQTAQPNLLGNAIAEAGRRQDPLGRDDLLFLVQWDRFLALDADLTCLARFNTVDSSRLGWCEWRYKQPSIEWSLNFTVQNGSNRSEFGAMQTPWAVGARARFFF